MTIRIGQVVLDCRHPASLAEFWSAALGYHAEPSSDGSIHLTPGYPITVLPTIWLQPTDEPKHDKNRVHIDLVADDPEAEVERLLSLGAMRTDVGQTGDESFVVLSDPEGNEFCVLDNQRTAPPEVDR
jgi:hypothetical protein